MKMPTMNGNTIMIPWTNLETACEFAMLGKLQQFSVREAEGCVVLSTPVTPHLEAHIPGILHGARARARDTEGTDPKPPTGGGDGTPPSGGTPGSTSVWQQTFTEARAA